ncbi:hypothetical protein THIOM_004845 [Candidatus Thiomargarita nelsonii]|uniref:Uncharacterized protein n=1 Tax=Candidatus Thiomargarita nelsonii TaxID=1003181 RepID=A0A176RUV7_9GAMM|nr:hypothetical protein THIOM_004845 [Candidatus Thiomargarita nelsonii]
MPNHDDYELHDEYDLSSMKIVEKGRYARRAGKNMVLLAPKLNKTTTLGENQAAYLPFNLPISLKKASLLTMISGCFVQTLLKIGLKISKTAF